MTSAPPSVAGRFVLLVEDDYFIADDLRRALQRIGIEVLGPVPTVGDALGLLASSPRVDAAVLDINLDSGGPVFPVADMLQARGVPFVFATGYDRADIPQRFSLIKRFEKPYDPAQIVQMLFG